MYADLGDTANAENLLRQSIKDKEDSLGPRDPLTALAYSALGNLIESQGRPGDAAPFYDKALRIQRDVGSSRFLPDAILDVAQLQEDTGTRIKMLHEAAAAVDDASPWDLLVKTEIALAETFIELEELGDAARHAVQAVRLAAARAPGSPQHADALAIHSSVLAHAGQFKSAAVVARRSLDISRAAAPHHKRKLATLEGNLGLYLVRAGDPTAGMELLKKSLSELRELLPPEDPTVRHAYDLLITSLFYFGNIAEADRVAGEYFHIYGPQGGSEMEDEFGVPNDL